MIFDGLEALERIMDNVHCCNFPNFVPSDDNLELVCGSCGEVLPGKTFEGTLSTTPELSQIHRRAPYAPRLPPCSSSAIRIRSCVFKSTNKFNSTERFIGPLSTLRLEDFKLDIAELFDDLNNLRAHIIPKVSERRLFATCVLAHARTKNIPLTLKDVAAAFRLSTKRLLRDFSKIKLLIPKFCVGVAFDNADYSSMMCAELPSEFADNGYLKDFKLLFEFSDAAGLLIGRPRNVVSAAIALLVFEIGSRKTPSTELIRKLSVRCHSSPATLLRRSLELKRAIIKYAIQYPFFEDLNKRNLVNLLPEFLLLLRRKNTIPMDTILPPAFENRKTRESKLLDLIRDINSRIERTTDICDAGLVGSSSFIRAELEDDVDADSLDYVIEQMLLSGMKFDDIIDACEKEISTRQIDKSISMKKVSSSYTRNNSGH